MLARWENFYVIVGSSAGALTGLQFVVITLVSQAQAIGTMREIRAFASPTVVHFCAALLISASISAPWTSILHLGLCLAVFGAAGLGYAHSVIWHARKQTGYAADRGDWFWYVALPLVVYAGLTAGGILLAFGWNGVCSGSRRPLCYFYSSGFTTPGIPLPTLRSSTGGDPVRVKSRVQCLAAERLWQKLDALAV